MISFWLFDRSTTKLEAYILIEINFLREKMEASKSVKLHLTVS